MAKKLGKALLFTALASAAAAGGIALYNKYKASSEDFDEDFLDFDDEDEDFDDISDDVSRDYVSIPREAADDAVIKDDNYKVNVDVTLDTSNFKDDDEDDDIFFVNIDDEASKEEATDTVSDATAATSETTDAVDAVSEAADAISGGSVTFGSTPTSL